MNIKRELGRKFREEYSQLSPDITKMVVWYVTGANHRTFEQVYADFLKEDEKHTLRPKESNDRFVYTILLELGRECCQNTKLINKFRDVISKVRLQVNMKYCAKPMLSNAQLITNHSSIIGDVESRKRKFIPEDRKDEHLKPGNTNA